jgi:hypothetical protein
MQIARLADVRVHRAHEAPTPPRLSTLAPPDVGAVGTRSDLAFRALVAAYRSLGGLAHADEVSTLLERRRGLDGGQLRRWRIERSVVGFGWQSHSWLPRFQFELSGVLPDAGVAAVLAVLGTVFDDWQTAWWFALPHPALDDRAPAEAIGRDLAAVLVTARGDRFVARG